MSRRKLAETISSVSYIGINNTVLLFFKAVCQAYLSEHISQLGSTKHIPHVLVHYPSAVSVLAESYRKNHWGRKNIKINVDYSLGSIFLY